MVVAGGYSLYVSLYSFFVTIWSKYEITLKQAPPNYVSVETIAVLRAGLARALNLCKHGVLIVILFLKGVHNLTV